MTTINPTHLEAFTSAQQAHGKALRLASAIASKLQVPDPIKALLGVSAVPYTTGVTHTGLRCLDTILASSQERRIGITGPAADLLEATLDIMSARVIAPHEAKYCGLVLDVQGPLDNGRYTVEVTKSTFSGHTAPIEVELDHATGTLRDLPTASGLPQDPALMEAVAAMNKATAEQTAAAQAHADATGVSLSAARAELTLGRLKARRHPAPTGIAPLDAHNLRTGDLLLIYGDAAQRVADAILNSQSRSILYTSALSQSTKADYLSIAAFPDLESARTMAATGPALVAMAEEAPGGMVVLTVQSEILEPVLIAI